MYALGAELVCAPGIAPGRAPGGGLGLEKDPRWEIDPRWELVRELRIGPGQGPGQALDPPVGIDFR